MFTKNHAFLGDDVTFDLRIHGVLHVFFWTSGLFEVHLGCTWSKSRWWFQIFFLTTILGSSWSNLTVAYFSNGLVQPPTEEIHPWILVTFDLDDLDGMMNRTWVQWKPRLNLGVIYWWEESIQENQFSRDFLARTWPPTIVTKCFIPFYSYICRIFRVCSTKKGWFCSPIAYLKQVVSRMEDGIADAAITRMSKWAMRVQLWSATKVQNKKNAKIESYRCVPMGWKTKQF